jgi:hypothetical protein
MAVTTAQALQVQMRQLQTGAVCRLRLIRAS